MSNLVNEIITLYHDILDEMKLMTDASLLIDKVQRRNAMVELLLPQLSQEQARDFMDIILPLQHQEESYLLPYKQELNKISHSINSLRLLEQYR